MGRLNEMEVELGNLHLTYIYGEPGVGKSTLVAALTEGLEPEATDSPVPFLRYDCGVVELGRRREDFSGTDAMSMSIQPKVVAFLKAIRPRLVLAEGDRLANAKFFNAVEALGYVVHKYQLWGLRVAAAQRAARGSKQDETWLLGRQTKVANLRRVVGGVILPAGAPLGELVERMTDPVAMALRTAKEAAP